MKRFISNTLLFAIPVLLLIVSTELFLRNIPNDYSYKSNFLKKHASEIEVLYLGNSHVFYGIDPTYSNYKGFNAAHISQSLNYDLAILEKYKESWKSLKYVVVPIDYFSLFSTLEEGQENWRIKNYTLYYHIGRYRNIDQYFEILNGKSEKNFSRIISYYVYGKSDVTCNKAGWGTAYHSNIKCDLDKTGSEAVNRHSYTTTNNPCFDNNVQTLESLIQVCNELHCKLFFITCPAYKTYLNRLNPQQLETTIQTIQQFTQKHPEISYHNFISDTSFVAGDFYDADHLNEIGAHKFTLMVNSLLLPIKK